MIKTRGGPPSLTHSRIEPIPPYLEPRRPLRNLARALQPFGADVKYVQMEGSGHNALDFHIAYYLGRLAVEHPEARFQIVSKDAGFDPLVAHLRARELLCERQPSLNGRCRSELAD